jgi:hypothetical protein
MGVAVHFGGSDWVRGLYDAVFWIQDAVQSVRTYAGYLWQHRGQIILGNVRSIAFGTVVHLVEVRLD